jgi:hypothetical protein
MHLACIPGGKNKKKPLHNRTALSASSRNKSCILRKQVHLKIVFDLSTLTSQGYRLSYAQLLPYGQLPIR